MINAEKGLNKGVAFAVFHSFKDREPYREKMKRSFTTIEDIENNLKKMDWVVGIYDDKICIGAIWAICSEVALAIIHPYENSDIVKKIIEKFLKSYLINNAFIMIRAGDKRIEKLIEFIGFKRKGMFFYLEKSFL